MMNKKQFLGVLISVLVCVFVIVLISSATTTIGDSIVVGSDGTAATPAINFADDTNTGIYREGTDTLNFATLGKRSFSIIGHATSPIIIGGYSGNSITADKYGAAILSGGQSGSINRIEEGYFSVIAGGEGNTMACSEWGSTANFIGSGYGNTIGGINPVYSSIVGGRDNIISGRAEKSFIGGGHGNIVSGSLQGIGNDVIGGGYGNTITGGGYGAIAGGQNNSATHYAFIGSGGSNTASGTASMIPGGYYNIASGSRSWAAGRRAEAIHQGAFVWADDHDVSFESELAHEVAFRASGGMRIVVAGANDLFRVFDDTNEVFTITDGGNASFGETASFSKNVDLGDSVVNDIVSVNAILRTGRISSTSLPSCIDALDSGIVNIYDSDDCTAKGGASGDGVICICTAASTSWEVVGNY